MKNLKNFDEYSKQEGEGNLNEALDMDNTSIITAKLQMLAKSINSKIKGTGGDIIGDPIASIKTIDVKVNLYGLSVDSALFVMMALQKFIKKHKADIVFNEYEPVYNLKIKLK